MRFDRVHSDEKVEENQERRLSLILRGQEVKTSEALLHPKNGSMATASHDKKHPKNFGMTLAFYVSFVGVMFIFVGFKDSWNFSGWAQAAQKVPFLFTGSEEGERDLSTPSSRLAGHWVDVDSGYQLYYTPIDKDLKMGTYRLLSDKNNISDPIAFKILSETPSNNSLVIREFNDSVELEARTSMKMTQSDATICISEDGLSMTKVYPLSGSPMYSVYSFIDSDTGI